MSVRRIRQLARKIGPAGPYAAIATADQWAWQHTHYLFGIHGFEALLAITTLPWLARHRLVPVDVRMAWRQLRYGHGRPAIPARLRHLVRRIDGSMCVACGSTYDLEIDHIRPWSCGGVNRIWNLALLCSACNGVKSNYWVWRSGRVTYNPYSRSDIGEAAAILAVERRHRRSPVRWVKAAFALA